MPFVFFVLPIPQPARSTSVGVQLNFDSTCWSTAGRLQHAVVSNTEVGQGTFIILEIENKKIGMCSGTKSQGVRYHRGTTPCKSSRVSMLLK